jgi:hypothetical protein
MLLSAQMITTGVLAEIFLRQNGGGMERMPLSAKIGFDK